MSSTGLEVSEVGIDLNEVCIDVSNTGIDVDELSFDVDEIGVDEDELAFDVPHGFEYPASRLLLFPDGVTCGTQKSS